MPQMHIDFLFKIRKNPAVLEATARGFFKIQSAAEACLGSL